MTPRQLRRKRYLAHAVIKGLMNAAGVVNRKQRRSICRKQTDEVNYVHGNLS